MYALDCVRRAGAPAHQRRAGLRAAHDAASARELCVSYLSPTLSGHLARAHCAQVGACACAHEGGVTNSSTPHSTATFPGPCGGCTCRRRTPCLCSAPRRGRRLPDGGDGALARAALGGCCTRRRDVRRSGGARRRAGAGACCRRRRAAGAPPGRAPGRREAGAAGAPRRPHRRWARRWLAAARRWRRRRRRAARLRRHVPAAQAAAPLGRADAPHLPAGAAHKKRSRHGFPPRARAQLPCAARAAPACCRAGATSACVRQPCG
jgi:hypothetical protein